MFEDFYSIAQIGISYINYKDVNLVWNIADEKNIGMHYGIGVGYTYKNFIFEFLYSYDNANYKNNLLGWDDNGETIVVIAVHKNYIKYQTFNFNVGYKFGFNFPEIKRREKQPKVR